MPTFLQFIKGSLQSSKRTNPVNSWEGMKDKIKSKYSHRYSQANDSHAAVLLMVKGYLYTSPAWLKYEPIRDAVNLWHQAPTLLHLYIKPRFSASLQKMTINPKVFLGVGYWRAMELGGKRLLCHQSELSWLVWAEICASTVWNG